MPWICMAFFGSCALILGWSAFDRRPQLRVARDGIWWRRWSRVRVPWSEVEDVETLTIRGDHYVRILIRDHQRYPASGIAALLKRSQWAEDMTIPLTHYDRSSEEILAAIGCCRSP